MSDSHQVEQVMVPESDRCVLRELGQRKAEIAALSVQQERRQMWSKLNGLASVRPMVWLFEVPWHEMGVDDALDPVCVHPFCRNLEIALRRELYQWEHMQGDMVVEPTILVPPVLRDTGFGLSEDVDVERTDAASSVVSRHFNIQIASEEDINKIQMQHNKAHLIWDKNKQKLMKM